MGKRCSYVERQYQEFGQNLKTNAWSKQERHLDVRKVMELALEVKPGVKTQ